MKTRLTLRARILFPILGILALGLAGMIGAVVLLTGAEFRKNAFGLNEAVANRYAQQVSAELAGPVEVARSLAQTFLAMKASGITSRNAYDAVLKNALASHPGLLSTWTIWEPNALDGRDKEFANKTGNDATGRYIPGWTRNADGSFHVDAGNSYDDPVNGAYYQVPKATRKEYFADPYFYSYTGKKEDQYYETSYCVPLILDDVFLGAVGVDLDLTNLGNLTKDIHVFGTGYVFVISNSGLRITHPKADLVGKLVGDDTPKEKDALLKAVAEGRDFNLTKPNLSTGAVSMVHYAPIGVGLWEKPWSLVSTAPLDQVLAIQNLVTAAMALLALVTFLVIGLAVLALVSRITRPVGQVARILQTIADGEGDLTHRLNLDRNDEIGDLSRAYDAFVDKLSEMIRRMQGTSGRLQEAGADLSAALTETAASLHQITSNIGSAKDNVVRQESIAVQTSEAVSSIGHHVTTLQDLVQRQDSAVGTSGSAIEQMVGNIESVSRNVETLDRSLKRLVDAAEVGRSQLASFREKVGSVDGQSASLQETNDVIASIASQTNLLAMNAAIEAAHAGEAGRGFAVVADEIRKLAEQAGLQSKSTASELKALQGTIRALVGDSESTEGAFGRILEEIGQVEALESEVRLAMDEQQVGSRQILESLNDIRDASQQVSSHSGEMRTEADRSHQTMEILHRVTLEIRQGMDEIAIGTSDINQALAMISEQGVKNKESVDELAEETGQFRLR